MNVGRGQQSLSARRPA